MYVYIYVLCIYIICIKKPYNVVNPMKQPAPEAPWSKQCTSLDAAGSADRTVILWSLESFTSVPWAAKWRCQGIFLGEWMANGWRMDGEWWRMIWINYVLSLNGLTAASLEKWLIIGHCPDAARCFQLSAWIWKKQPTPDRWWNMMNYWLVFVDDVLPLIKSLLANVVVLTRSSSWIYRDNTTDSHSGELVLQIPGNIRYMTWILL
jgi:hypothetical protein